MSGNNMQHLDFVKQVLENDHIIIHEKESTYKGSWKKRGGIGAFMMLARKWDRIENACEEHNYDLISVIMDDGIETRDGVLDDVADLRRYLTLVEAEARSLASQVGDSVVHSCNNAPQA